MHRYRFSFKNKVFRQYFISLSTIVAIIITGFVLVPNTENKDLLNNKEPLFSPIVERADLPFKYDTINAESGGIIEPATNTMIIIPPNAFIDENNEDILGEIHIMYRGFTDMVALLNAGIPIDIEENNQQYDLESATICEIYALKDGKPLKIKPGKEIEIIQPSYTTSRAFNIYQYDEEHEKWIEKGKDIPMELSGQVVNNELLTPSYIEIHIENPPKDSLIIKQLETYMVLLKKLEALDSINNTIEQRNVKINHLEIDKDSLKLVTITVKKMNILLSSGITDKEIKVKLSQIKINKNNITSNKVFINREYQKQERALELFYKRQILLYNTKNERLISVLMEIAPRTSTLLDKKELINQEYAIFQANRLGRLDSSIIISRTYSIDRFGLWNSAYPIKQSTEVK